MITPEIGTTIDDLYQIDDHIGSGGFGKVYEVTDISSGEKIALKVCTSDNSDDKRRFQREVKIMQSIDHRNVMTILNCNLETEPIYFTMPLARYSLDKEIDFFVDDSKNQYKTSLKVFIEVCKGINAIHQSKAVHRDIKPQNILVVGNNKVVVSDLGLGKFEERDTTVITDSHAFLGTDGYIPPEYKDVGGTINADARGDIFQLGKTLYYMLTGKDPSYIQIDLLPPELGHVISRATKGHPNDRYQTVSELLDTIDTYLYSLDPTKSPEYIFKINLEEAEILAEEGTFKKENILKLLSSINECEGNNTLFLNLFDSLSSKLLKIISINFSDELGQTLNKYTLNLDIFLDNYGYNFAYAEIVASKMGAVYRYSNNFDYKKIALRNILVSSVVCNRYAAIDIFVYIVSSIKDNGEALAITEMLKCEKKYFNCLANQLQKSSLHPAIQTLWDEIDSNGGSDIDINLP